MITAKEAKELYDKSGAEVELYLIQLEKQIQEAAKGGKRQVITLIGSKELFEHLDQLITPLQKVVVDKLKELGYQAEIKLYGERYVPRGLADDDGNGPKHQNYGIQIGW